MALPVRIIHVKTALEKEPQRKPEQNTLHTADTLVVEDVLVFLFYRLNLVKDP